MTNRDAQNAPLQLWISVPRGWSLGRIAYSTPSDPDGVAGEFLFLVNGSVNDFEAAVRAAIKEWRSTRPWSETHRPNWGDALVHLPLDLWFRHGVLPVHLPITHGFQVDHDESFLTRAEAHAEAHFAARDLREAAVRPTVSEPLRAAGYEIIDTGGGCLAWFRPVSPDGAELLLITSNNDIDGDPEHPEWEIGRYSENGWVNEESFTLAEAIRNAALLPPPMDGVEGMYPTVAAARAALLREEA